jgi:mono/diheme cytochrome c family protein
MQTVMLTLFLLCVPAQSALAEAQPAPTEPITFEKNIRPIFKANCFPCHGEGEKLNGKLDVRWRRLLAQGGQSGPAIVPGDPNGSLLFQRISSGEMPPGNKKVTPHEISLISRWIAAGAPTARPESDQLPDGFAFTDDERSYWAFQPIRRTDEPKVRQTRLVRSPVDAFLLAKLEENELTFSAQADKRTLMRRAYFDLIGLPPTAEEVDLFLADDAPDAYERLLDRLLASPHYGERWGRHWLDVAGYADSEGYTNEDQVRKEAYKYRDYVIRSLNADKPFDQFIQEQLAGDEMVSPQIITSGYKNLTPEAIERLVATGFLRMAPDGTASRGVDQKQASNQVIADTIKIVSTSLMGLTVGCAQCHNHRYDPIPQSDYYRLRAIFEPALDWKNWRPPRGRLVSLYTDANRDQAAEIEVEAAKIDAQRAKKQQEYINQTFDKEVAKLPEDQRDSARAARNTAVDKRTEEQNRLLKENPSLNVSAGSLYLYDQKAADELKKMADEASKIRATKPVEEFLRSLTEVPGNVPTTFLFNRGDHDQPAQPVTPGDLSILAATSVGAIPDKDPSLPTTGRRLAFARKLTNGTHPLVARVIVNRIWMHHFGRGIVAKPGDFGFLGDPPTHPELLDWLAMEFMNPSHTPPYEGGKGAWRLKRLHKLMMNSTAYRQVAVSMERGAIATSDGPVDRTGQSLRAGEIDPDNRLLWRMPVRRLEAEVIRDAVLAVSGKLNIKMFGPPVPIKEDEVGQVVVGIDTTDSAGRPTGKEISLGGEEHRRSLYIQVRRSKPLALLDTFDEPTMEPNCEARTSSTVAPQSLLLMNNEFVLIHARHLAERVLREAAGDTPQLVPRLWRLVFAREPADPERADAAAFLEHQTETFRANAPATAKSPNDKETVPQAGSDPQVRALTVLCQALLSANEFLYID